MDVNRAKLILLDLKPEDVARASEAMKRAGMNAAQALRNVREAWRLYRLEKKGEKDG